MAVTIALAIVAICAVLYALRCRVELKRWSNLFQTSRIAISYKRKVKLQAPLSEWALWCKELDRDADVNGRVVYVGAQTRVAITKALPRKVTRNNRDKPQRQGRWQARDETERRVAQNS